MSFQVPLSTLFPTIYTQGVLAVFTAVTMDVNANPVPPDNLNPPILNLAYTTPVSAIPIINNQVMIPITNTFYYADIDTSTLNQGSYVVQASWYVNGQLLNNERRFDVVAGDGFTLYPVDPISRLRIRLNDNNPDPSLWVFSDQELSLFLQDALDDMNAAPPRTGFTWVDVPLYTIPNIMQGAEIYALQSRAIKVAHSPVVYSDKGVTVSKPGQVQTYLNISEFLFKKYEQERLRIKRNMQPAYGYIVTPSAPYLSNIPMRALARTWF